MLGLFFFYFFSLADVYSMGIVKFSIRRHMMM